MHNDAQKVMLRRWLGIATVILLALAINSQALAAPPGAPRIITIPLFNETSGSAKARCVLRQNLDEGTEWLVFSLTSASGAISGNLNQMGQGVFAISDGVLSIEIGSGGQGVLSLEPSIGPPLVIMVSPSGSWQSSGDVVATTQSMPITFGGPLGDDLVGLGLDLGLIEPAPAGGFQTAPGVEQQWGIGNQCRKATAKSVATLLAGLGGGVMCSRGNVAACLALPAAGFAIYEKISEQYQICLNTSN